MTPISAKEHQRLLTEYNTFISERQGFSWSQSEQENLQTEFKNNNTRTLAQFIADRAVLHRRSARGIIMRLEKLNLIVVHADQTITLNIHTTTQENTMTSTNFEKKELVLIRGKDAANMSDDDIFTLISELKGQINHLQNMGVESTKITKRIGELNDDVANLIMYVDNR